MQGECAVIVQVWPETPPDVPLNICCYSLELGPCFQSDIDEDRIPSVSEGMGCMAPPATHRRAMLRLGSQRLQLYYTPRRKRRGP